MGCFFVNYRPTTGQGDSEWNFTVYLEILLKMT